MRRLFKPLFKSFLIPALLAVALFGFSTAAFAQSSPVDLQFANHPQAGFPEQDVFVEQGAQVVRLDAKEATDSANQAKSVFTSATATAHDPFKLGANPLGPFAKGHSLGFSLGDWLGGTGSGTYTIDGDSAQLNLTFQKLVPNANYTVWCSRLTFPPNVKVVDRPCGKEDGSENVFKTDAQGNGSFSLKLKPLEESTKETASVIALAYHSDGKTYGSDPGEFGSKTHVQLFSLIHPKEAVAAENSSAPASVASTTGLSKKAWALIIGAAVVIIGGAWWYLRRSKTV